MITKMVRMALLYDIYGEFLTPRQRKFFSLHYEKDLSLGEISNEFGVTRQAVHDTLKRAEASLERYESRLGLVARYLDNRSDLEILLERVDELEETGPEHWHECLQIFKGEIVKLLHNKEGNV